MGKVLVIASLWLGLTACAEILPEDPNPEKQACVEQAQVSLERCYSWTREGFEEKCEFYYEQDLVSCGVQRSGVSPGLGGSNE